MRLRPLEDCPAQPRVLRAIAQSIEDRGFPPSLPELAAGQGVTRHAIECVLHALWRRGLITKAPRIVRSLRLTPAGLAALAVLFPAVGDQAHRRRMPRDSHSPLPGPRATPELRAGARHRRTRGVRAGRVAVGDRHRRIGRRRSRALVNA
jgi:DNA-binding MarR family transcriptional regulator